MTIGGVLHSIHFFFNSSDLKNCLKKDKLKRNFKIRPKKGGKVDLFQKRGFQNRNFFNISLNWKKYLKKGELLVVNYRWIFENFLENFRKNGEKDTPFFFQKSQKLLKKVLKKRSEKLKSQKLLKKGKCLKKVNGVYTIILLWISNVVTKSSMATIEKNRIGARM